MLVVEAIRAGIRTVKEAAHEGIDRIGCETSRNRRAAGEAEVLKKCRGLNSAVKC